MKFAHMGDCHLGGWRQPELKDLNLRSFQFAMDKCIRERVEFILITGDLFDSAYPPIDILKNVFWEFRKLKEANIPIFLIAGSHDYSVSGKTFLDVLEKAGFCKNAAVFEERDSKIVLQPTIFRNFAIYGYPGKKSSMEIEDIKRIAIQDSPLFKILMLHTSIKDAVSSLPIESVDQDKLPKVDYVALSHLHINYNKGKFVYSGPIFPNNISELEELKAGSFYIITDGKVKKEEIKLYDVAVFNLEITNALTATEEILSNLQKENLRNKIVILKLYGILEKGKSTDIDFQKIEDYVRKQNAFVFLKSTTKLHLPEPDIKIDVVDSANMEAAIIKKFEETNPNKFNYLIPSLLRTLQMEKLDDEKSSVFEDRLISEAKKVLKYDN